MCYCKPLGYSLKELLSETLQNPQKLLMTSFIIENDLHFRIFRTLDFALFSLIINLIIDTVNIMCI